MRHVVDAVRDEGCEVDLARHRHKLDVVKARQFACVGARVQLQNRIRPNHKAREGQHPQVLHLGGIAAAALVKKEGAQRREVSGSVRIDRKARRGNAIVLVEEGDPQVIGPAGLRAVKVQRRLAGLVHQEPDQLSAVIEALDEEPVGREIKGLRLNAQRGPRVGLRQHVENESRCNRRLAIRGGDGHLE